MGKTKTEREEEREEQRMELFERVATALEYIVGSLERIEGYLEVTYECAEVGDEPPPLAIGANDDPENWSELERFHPRQYAYVSGLFFHNTENMSDDEVRALAREKGHTIANIEPVDRFNRCPNCEEWSPCHVRECNEKIDEVDDDEMDTDEETDPLMSREAAGKPIMARSTVFGRIQRGRPICCNCDKSALSTVVVATGEECVNGCGRIATGNDDGGWSMPAGADRW